MLAVNRKLTNSVDIRGTDRGADRRFVDSVSEKWRMTPVNSSAFAGFHFASGLVNNNDAEATRQSQAPQKETQNPPQQSQPDPTFGISEASPPADGTGVKLDISV